MAIINQSIASGMLAALNATLDFPPNAHDSCGALTIQVSGTYVGTLTLDGSVDGVNYVAIPVRNSNTAYAQLLNLPANGQGIFFAPISGFKAIRVRMTSYTSGTATVTLSASTAAFETHVLPKSSDSHAQAQGASGATATLTLPASSGFFHNITHLSIELYRAGALTGGATPISVTTTNLNSLGFIFPTDGAIGTTYPKTIEPCTPIRSQAIGTATTIIMPAITNVLWRAYATYYLAN